MPYDPRTGRRASVARKEDWCDFAAMAAAVRASGTAYDGAALNVTKESGLIFIDIDHCIRTEPELKGSPLLEEALRLFSGTYGEFSQSGTGWHILVRGTIPRGFKRSDIGLEMYDSRRYCALTGHAGPNGEPAEMQAALDTFFARYAPPPRERGTPKAVLQKTAARALPPDAVILARVGASGQRARLLLAGDWQSAGFPSQSEADLSLAGTLMYYTGNDAAAADRLFRISGLYRPKWERAEYRERTLALAVQSAIWEPRGEKTEKKEVRSRQPRAGQERKEKRYAAYRDAFLSQ